MPECFKRNGYMTFGRGKLFHSQPHPRRKKAMWDNEVWGGGFGHFPPEKDQVNGKVRSITRDIISLSGFQISHNRFGDIHSLC